MNRVRSGGSVISKEDFDDDFEGDGDDYVFDDDYDHEYYNLADDSTNCSRDDRNTETNGKDDSGVPAYMATDGKEHIEYEYEYAHSVAPPTPVFNDAPVWPLSPSTLKRQQQQQLQQKRQQQQQQQQQQFYVNQEDFFPSLQTVSSSSSSSSSEYDKYLESFPSFLTTPSSAISSATSSSWATMARQQQQQQQQPTPSLQNQQPQSVFNTFTMQGRGGHNKGRGGDTYGTSDKNGGRGSYGGGRHRGRNANSPRGGRFSDRERDRQIIPSNIPRSDKPIIITIGPPCSGKTTFIAAKSILDTAIDDAPFAYKKMLIKDIMKYADTLGTDSQEEKVFKQKYCERLKAHTIFERYRMMIESEQIQILYLFEDKISIDEFISAMNNSLSTNFGGSTELCEMLVGIIVGMKFEEYSEISPFVTPTVDIFCRDLIYPESVTWAQNRFIQAVVKNPDQCVSWGNTNLKPKDYQLAIELAEKADRPVQFVRSGYELPPMTLQDLMRRNILRFFKTGRFIPTTVLERTLDTSERMLNVQFPTQDLLCSAVGFMFDSKSSRVSRIPSPVSEES